MSGTRSATFPTARGTELEKGWIAMEQAARVALTFELDAESLRLWNSLKEAKIDALLLKGLAIQTWLYGNEFRPCGDIDLLVHPCQMRVASDLLASHGYIDPFPGVSHLEQSLHARTLIRADGLVVDLHTRLNNTTAAPDLVAACLLENSQILSVHGRQIRVCTPVAQFVVIALHAAQHGRHEPKPIEDLRRANAKLDAGDLELAAELAQRLGASESFAMGIRFLPEVARRMPAVVSTGVSDLVLAQAEGLHAMPGLFLLAGMQELDWASRLSAIGRAMWPTADFLRSKYPQISVERETGLLLGLRFRRGAFQLRHARSAVREFRGLHRRPR
jgi:hypothetical protein